MICTDSPSRHDRELASSGRKDLAGSPALMGILDLGRASGSGAGLALRLSSMEFKVNQETTSS